VTAAGPDGAPRGVLGTAIAPTHVRYWIVALLFLATTINYADRATLSIVGVSLSADLKIDAVAMGYVFSAFGWAYVIGQLPGGWLLDRFGSRRVYIWSLLAWSAVTSRTSTIRRPGSLAFADIAAAMS